MRRLALIVITLWHKAFKNSRYTEGYACEFLKTFYHQHLSTREAFIHKNHSTQVKETGVDGDWLLTGKGDMYGDYKKIITKEEAIKALFGDKPNDMVLFLLEAIKDPKIRITANNS